MREDGIPTRGLVILDPELGLREARRITPNYQNKVELPFSSAYALRKFALESVVFDNNFQGSIPVRF